MTQTKVGRYTCKLSPELLEKAKKELNEDPSTRHLEIQTIKERLLRYPGLSPCVDEDFLIRFLRASKFDQERTFALILRYYRMKKDNEDIYASMTPSSVKHIFDAGVVCILPGRSRNGEIVLIHRPGRFEADKLPVTDMYKTMFLALNTVIESEETQVNGIRYIEDQTDVNWSHIKVLTPSIAMKFSKLLQESFPMRLKAVHFVHQPAIFDAFLQIIKPLMKKKLASRLNFHGEKVEGLHQFIDPKHLPEEYSGKLPPISSQEFTQSVLQRESYFEAASKYGFVNMTLKHVKSEDAIETLPGTFKKLNID